MMAPLAAAARLVLVHEALLTAQLASGAIDHAWRLVGHFTHSHGICLPPYQNTIGEREPSILDGPLELNFHSYGGWCPVSYGTWQGVGIYHR